MSSSCYSSSDAAAVEKKAGKVPITLLTGFLGAGKTTTLKHLLENTDGTRVGVIVNDVAAVNIDAKLVSNSATTNGGGVDDGVVELKNGCACCSLADELLSSVDTLIGSNDRGRTFDALVVELSGVADPTAIKLNWRAAADRGHPVAGKADVARVVALVDASTFGTDWMSLEAAGDRERWADDGHESCAATAARVVPELLAEQVEAADLILVNKRDLAGPEQAGVASSLARSINKKAELEEVEYGAVTPQRILGQQSGRRTAEKEKCCGDPGCSSDKNAKVDLDDDKPNKPSVAGSNDNDRSHKLETDKLGIKSFVYKAIRPFDVARLLELLGKWPVPIKDKLDLSLLREAQQDGCTIRGVEEEANPFAGVLRSKGFCWFSPTSWSGAECDAWRHDTAMYWSHAGKHFGLSASGSWWATVGREEIKSQFKGKEGEYERMVNEDFVTEEFGDRRQEIVFIGVGLNEDEITRKLDRCLLSEEEMKFYRKELGSCVKN